MFSLVTFCPDKNQKTTTLQPAPCIEKRWITSLPESDIQWQNPARGSDATSKMLWGVILQTTFPRLRKLICKSLLDVRFLHKIRTKKWIIYKLFVTNIHTFEVILGIWHFLNKIILAKWILWLPELNCRDRFKNEYRRRWYTYSWYLKFKVNI